MPIPKTQIPSGDRGFEELLEEDSMPDELYQKYH